MSKTEISVYFTLSKKCTDAVYGMLLFFFEPVLISTAKVPIRTFLKCTVPVAAFIFF